jgi:hypothetical protein
MTRIMGDKTPHYTLHILPFYLPLTLFNQNQLSSIHILEGDVITPHLADTRALPDLVIVCVNTHTGKRDLTKRQDV